MILSPNEFNELYYTRCEDALAGGSLANLFVAAEEINMALARVISEKVKRGAKRIKEFSVGAVVPRRYQYLDGKVEVILSDIGDSWIDLEKYRQIADRKVSFLKEACDLRGELEFAGAQRRVDLALFTYAFDSVWLLGDIFLSKEESGWWSEEIGFETVSIPEGNLSVGFFDQMKKVKRKTLVKVDEYSFGDLIIDRYGGLDSVRIGVAFGVVKKIMELFERQMSDDGEIWIGDTGVNDPEARKKTNKKWASLTGKSGRVAIFKTDDYALIKLMLEKEGFLVSLWDLNDWLEEMGQDRLFFCQDQLVMKVRKSS